MNDPTFEFITEINQKQAVFSEAPITDEEIINAVEKVKEAIRKITDDPLNFNVRGMTLYYKSRVDDNYNPTGICDFWADDDRKNILFTMTVAHFQVVERELGKMHLSESYSLGRHEGHCHLHW